MGIDFSHGGAHWSYSAFNRFRVRVATSIGIPLERMESFKPFDAQDDWVGIPWKKVKHPLKPFLHHSDCDGTLSAKQCAVIAPALRKVISQWVGIPQWVDVDEDYDIKKCLLLCDGMDDAANKNQRFKFQ